MERTAKEKSDAAGSLEKLFNTMPSMAACCYMRDKLSLPGPVEGYWVTHRCTETGAFSTSPQLLQAPIAIPTSYNVIVPAYPVRMLLELYYEKSTQEENPETVYQLFADAVARYIADYLSEDSDICDVNCCCGQKSYTSWSQTAISFDLCKRLTDYVCCGVTEFVWTYTDGAAIPTRVPRSSVGPVDTTASEPIHMIDAYTAKELYKHHMLPFNWTLETDTRCTETGEQYQFVISKPKYKDQVKQVSYQSRWFPAHVCADGFAAFFMDIQKL